MAQYKVESERLEGFKAGDVVTESDFAEGVNIDALIEGGFISPNKTKTAAPAAETAKD